MMTKRSFSRIEHKRNSSSEQAALAAGSEPAISLCSSKNQLVFRTFYSRILFVSVVCQFQFVQNVECQTHDHTNDTGQYHTCQLNASELYGNT